MASSSELVDRLLCSAPDPNGFTIWMCRPPTAARSASGLSVRAGGGEHNQASTAAAGRQASRARKRRRSDGRITGAGLASSLTRRRGAATGVQPRHTRQFITGPRHTCCRCPSPISTARQPALLALPRARGCFCSRALLELPIWAWGAETCRACTVCKGLPSAAEKG